MLFKINIGTRLFLKRYGNVDAQSNHTNILGKQ